MMNAKQEIHNLSHEYFADIVKWRRHLHRNPELSYKEYDTADFIENTLREIGYTDVKRMANTGVIACIGSQGENKAIGLRADIDALPIQEANESIYKSKNEGVMHACGHDVHTACLLGAAKILMRLKSTLKGQIKLVFQPAEEKLPGGASLLIKEGVLKDPDVGKMVGQHVHPPLAVGKLGFKPGDYMASADEIYLTITGKGGHAALPDNVIDPLIVTSQIILALQTVVSRNASPKTPTVLSFGKINSEGGATNVIPNSIKMEGTFRTFDEKWRFEAHKIIERIIENTCSAFGTSYSLDIKVGYPSLYNNEKETNEAKRLAIEYLGAENVVDLPLRTTAEDFAFYSHQVPSCFYRLGTGNITKGITSPVHTTTFDIDEEALRIGAGFMAFLAINK